MYLDIVNVQKSKNITDCYVKGVLTITYLERKSQLYLFKYKCVVRNG